MKEMFQMEIYLPKDWDWKTTLSFCKNCWMPDGGFMDSRADGRTVMMVNFPLEQDWKSKPATQAMAQAGQ